MFLGKDVCKGGGMEVQDVMSSCAGSNVQGGIESY